MKARKKIAEIQKIQNQINALLKKICNEKPLLKGTYTYVMKKCANPECSCHKKPKHPIHRITWIEKGKGKTLSIQMLNLKTVLKYNKHYRDFRHKRLKIVQLQDTLNNLICQLEKILIDNKNIIEKLKAEGKK